MNRFVKFIINLSFFFGSITNIYAFDVDVDFTYLEVKTDETYVLRDSSNKLSIDDVLNSDFEIQSNYHFKTADTIWLKLHLNNKSNKAIPLVLSLKNCSILDDVMSFYLISDKRREQQKIGNSEHLSFRDRYSTFKFQALPMEHAEIYLQIKSPFYISISSRIYSKKFYDRNVKDKFYFDLVCCHPGNLTTLQSFPI